MTPRERVQAVYRGERPDRVPLILDLSHWYKKNYARPFDLSGFTAVEHDLVELHKSVGAVAYVEMGSFFSLEFTAPGISVDRWTENGVFHTRITTPNGAIEERRVFNEASYSYAIEKYLLDSVDDFPVVCAVMDNCRARPNWQLYRAWEKALGEYGYIYAALPYSGLGYLISRYFGVENTIYTAFDHPDETRAVIEAVNRANLRILDELLDGPFETVFMSDNFDSNVQTKELFETYSRAYYAEVARRAHAAGKHLAVHVDGEMRGALSWMRDAGVDCIDAVTPAPMFSLTPRDARKEAGPNLILSGGIPPTVFGSMGSDPEFEDSVKSWLETREESHSLFLAAGDQVPPDAPFHRIAALDGLVERFGRYS
ncbi:MAG: hypothetical protein EA426_09095 [Spirochaetaceae bacterium]|nr:MAG: hypothetical protein EA426_09095 [Spirochaetaceae bacterium]